MIMAADSKRSSNTNSGTKIGTRNRISGNFNVNKRKNEGTPGARLVRLLGPAGVTESPISVSPVSNATTSLLNIYFYFCVLTVYVDDFP